MDPNRGDGELVHWAIAPYSVGVKNEFTAIIERDGKWFVAYCPELPGANGQGRTAAQAKKNLGEAIALILEDRRQDAFKGVPRSAKREILAVG